MKTAGNEHRQNSCLVWALMGGVRKRSLSPPSKCNQNYWQSTSLPVLKNILTDLWVSQVSASPCIFKCGKPNRDGNRFFESLFALQLRVLITWSHSAYGSHQKCFPSIWYKISLLGLFQGWVFLSLLDGCADWLCERLEKDSIFLCSSLMCPAHAQG